MCTIMVKWRNDGLHVRKYHYSLLVTRAMHVKYAVLRLCVPCTFSRRTRAETVILLILRTPTWSALAQVSAPSGRLGMLFVVIHVPRNPCETHRNPLIVALRP